MKINFSKQRRFKLYLLLAALIILAGVFAPVICKYGPAQGNLKDAFLPPSSRHFFGTDKLGQDVFSRVIYGARSSLPATFSLVGVIFMLGTLAGTVAGYFGSWIDELIMRISDMMLAFPGMVLAIAVAGILGPSIRNAVIAVAAVSWTKYARIARSLVLEMKNEDYIQAAKVVGTSDINILFRYMIPQIIPTLTVIAATDIGGMMLELAGLSFLGFGAKAPTPEWGLMLGEGRSYMQNAPWLMIFPGLAIFICVAVFNLLGDSIRDMLDPREE